MSYITKKSLKTFLRQSDLPAWAKLAVLAVWAGLPKKELKILFGDEALSILVQRGYLYLKNGRYTVTQEVQEQFTTEKRTKVGNEIINLLKEFYRIYANITGKEPVRSWAKHAKLLAELRDVLLREGCEQPLLTLQRLWAYYLNPKKKYYYYHLQTLEQFYRYFNKIRSDYEKYHDEVTEHEVEYGGEYW